MVVMFLVLHNDYHDGHQRRDVDSPSSEYLIIMKTYSSGLYMTILMMMMMMMIQKDRNTVINDVDCCKQRDC